MRLPSEPSGLGGMNVTVMGLGINGGGLAACRFLLRHGARLVITDLRDETILRPSLEALGPGDWRLVLGHHEMEDFRKADFIIKNPAVRPGNPFVQAASHMESDLSLFFRYQRNPLVGITGSKGKSTTASALHHCLSSRWPGSRLGGNITISPLSFIHELDGISPVVLELSSFQLGDLCSTTSFGQGLLSSFPPHIALLTNIYHDHQDYYGAMEPYVADKTRLLSCQTARMHSILDAQDEWTPRIVPRLPGQIQLCSARPLDGARAWLSLGSGEGSSPGKPNPFQGPKALFREADGSISCILPETLSLAGAHHRVNLLKAACAARLYGMEAIDICRSLAGFTGIPHRLETVREIDGVIFINDSAATIPDAVLAGVQSLEGPIHLICGGNDKGLDFSVFSRIRRQVKTLRLLSGSASQAIAGLLAAEGLDHQGIYDDLSSCVQETHAGARAGDFVLLSPGASSFGMFLNEFDRGNRYKDCVLSLT